MALLQFTPSSHNTITAPLFPLIEGKLPTYHHNTSAEFRRRFQDLARFNKIAIQGTPQMAVDKEAISLSRVYLNTILSVPAVILCVTRLN